MSEAAVAEVRKRLTCPEGVRRLGQALWMSVGEPVNVSDLLWARPLLGESAEDLLWAALEEQGCIAADGHQLDARGLAEFLCRLWYEQERRAGELLWTLPAQLPIADVNGRSYVCAAGELIDVAQTRLLFVSPYLEAEGVGSLQQKLLEALNRGVATTFVTHRADELGSWASLSLESLRREASKLAGSLSVYSAADDAGVLFHSKLVVQDGKRGTVGSANLTGRGLGRNVETGVTVGPAASAQIERVVAASIDARLLHLVFRTKP